MLHIVVKVLGNFYFYFLKKLKKIDPSPILLDLPLDTASAIGQHSEAPRIVALELEYIKADSNSIPVEVHQTHDRVLELITSMGGNLRDLTVRFSDDAKMDRPTLPGND